MFILYSYVFIYLIFVKKVEKLKDLKETFNFLGAKKAGLKEAIFFGLIIILILTLPSVVFIHKFRLPWYWEEEAPSWYNYLQIIYLLIVSAPVEEIAYRGYVLKKLASFRFKEKKKKAVGILIALLVSSILHAFWHLDKHKFNLLYYIQSDHFKLTILLGITCGLLYLRSKNILGPSLVHAYANIYPYSVLLFSFF